MNRAAKRCSYYLMKILCKVECDLNFGLFQQVSNPKNHRNYGVEIDCTKGHQNISMDLVQLEQKYSIYCVHLYTGPCDNSILGSFHFHVTFSPGMQILCKIRILNTLTLCYSKL